MPSAARAKLAHLNAVGRVPPGLIGLVVALLAFFACKGHSDADISACHSFLFYDAVTEEIPDANRARERRKA